MRIIFLTHNFPRHPGDHAGAFLLPLAMELRARGHDLVVLAPSDRGRGGEDAIGGVPVRRVRYAAPEAETLAYGGRLAASIRSPRGIASLWRMLRALGHAAEGVLASGPAVLHAHWWVPAGLAAPHGAPMVLTSHGTDATLLARMPPARWFARPVYRRARVVTAVSSYLAGLIRAGTGRTVDEVQPMPMSATPDAASPRVPAPGQYVTVSRLTAQKRVHLAIEAVALLRGSGKDVRLRVVGDGPERGALERLVRARQVGDRVEFTGLVPPFEVPDLVADAEAAVIPARGEGFGLAAVEALARGVPVVACRDGGGLLDVVSGTPGCRIADPTPQSIADALGSLRGDAAARAHAAAAGERWLLRLAPAAVADRAEAWYRLALDA
ncbi:MAG: glycosyltransferase [Gemmatimonadales bacterium]